MVSGAHGEGCQGKAVDMKFLEWLKEALKVKKKDGSERPEIRISIFKRKW